MLVIIIIIAIFAFLLVLFFFNYQEILNYFKNLFKKKPKKVKQKNNEEPKPEKETFTYEDFKPIVKEPENDRDSSIQELLNLNDFDDYEDYDDSLFNDEDNIFTGEIKETSNSNIFSEDRFDDIFKRYKGKKNKKSLAKQIRELPPEIKAMVIDNILNKRDDV